MEAIILAGGLGTRLRGVIGAQPKCMAPVNGRPFLWYLFQYLANNGCTRVILSLGYRHEVVQEWYRKTDWPFEIDYVVEHEPLGTGGGIQLAMRAAREAHVLVLNGDTMFRVDLPALLQAHHSAGAETTLALKPMQHFERYGVVLVNDTGTITGFTEKKYTEQGLINGGIYAIDRAAFLSASRPERFSFEQEYLEDKAKTGALSGFESSAYFIDIGIPADYAQAQEDFKTLFS